MVEPLVPADVDLRDFAFMPLDVRRLLNSETWIEASEEPKLAHVLICLWCESWHQVPAASLPDNDIVLARLAMCDKPTWLAIKDKALSGFVKCSDGRYYHPTVAEKAIEAWERKQSQRARTRKANERWGQTDAVEGNHKTRRSRRLSAARQRGSHTPAEWAALLAICDNQCVKCGSPNVIKDHIKPISSGGSDGIENLQPLCTSCNSGKGGDCTDHRPTDWRERLENAASRGVQCHVERLQGTGTVDSRKKIKTLAPVGAFERFWSAYPKRKSKGTALKAWNKIQPNEQLQDRILDALERAKTSADWRKSDGQFIPYPATWLNARGWEDEIGNREDRLDLAGAL